MIVSWGDQKQLNLCISESEKMLYGSRLLLPTLCIHELAPNRDRTIGSDDIQ